MTTWEAEARPTHGDRTTSPSSASENGSIDASRSSPEAQIERYFLQPEDEVGHFTHGKKCLLALLTFVHGAKGDRETSPSSARRNGSIDAARALLEAQIERDFMQLAGKAEHFGHGKKTTCLQFLALFVA